MNRIFSSHVQEALSYPKLKADVKTQKVTSGYFLSTNRAIES